MQSTELEFIIDTQGNVKTSVKGVQGPGCLADEPGEDAVASRDLANKPRE